MGRSWLDLGRPWEPNMLIFYWFLYYFVENHFFQKIISLEPFWTELGPTWAPKWAPRGAQIEPKIAPRPPQDRPKTDVQKKTQNRPPRWPIWGPKMGPKWDPKRTKIEDKIERQKSTSLRASWGDLGSIWDAPGARESGFSIGFCSIS